MRSIPKFLIRILLLTHFLSLANGLSSCAPSKLPKERNITIQASANFKKHPLSGKDFYHTLELEQGDDSRSVYWPHDAPNPATLNKNNTYSLEIIEEEHKRTLGGSSTSTWSPELLRLSDGKRLLYDASVCAVHGGVMERKVVPISYGFPMFDREYLKVENTEFPNTGMVLGGCVVDRDRPVTHAWVCTSCVYNKNKWEELKKGQNE
jgi:hypothetical protein